MPTASTTQTSPIAIAQRIAKLRRSPTPRIPQDRLPILVTGVSGVSGFNAFYYLSHHYPGQVFGQRPRETFRLNDTGILAFNLEDHESTRRVLREHRIRSVLSCGGNCALKSCELDPAMAHQVNVVGIESLLQAIEHAERSHTSGMFGETIRLVHLSVDLVFSGLKGAAYNEHDPPDPVTVYGSTMVAAEKTVQEHRPDACILRISLPMGVSFNGHAGAIDWIKSRFAAGRPATLYFDEVRTPTYVQGLNLVFEHMLSNSLSGLFHCGGTRQLSLFEIAQVINRAGNYDPHLLKGCYRIEAGPIPPRAGNVAMDSSKLLQLLSQAEPETGLTSLLMKWPYLDIDVPTHRTWHFHQGERGLFAPRGGISSTLYELPVCPPSEE
ncbi:MAG TPA: sugar nucleotide-binding protein [Pirellulaceae bacterium]|nr:sugar nucleotide-binding protein [Pirellulaceae bacterium]HMO92593.1 sugar nucleotide-binding protein [Pirellulaceae bacterium]HMP71355.1 sugar nucleotide-binding protein [Pirellulaceae bacterium]